MGQSGQPLGDRPEARQAAECCQDLHTIALAVAVSVFLELGVARPVPGVLDRPAVSHMPQQGLGCGPETGDVASTVLPSRLPLQGSAPLSGVTQAVLCPFPEGEQEQSEDDCLEADCSAPFIHYEP